MLVMDRVRHAAILPSAMTARSGPKQCSQNIQKNRCRTTVAEPIGETLTELPFTGDQAVCLGHDQAAWSGPELADLTPGQFRSFRCRIRLARHHSLQGGLVVA